MDWCAAVSYTHLAIDLAKKIDADIVMASDPDADRVGMACKNDKGEWVLINGCLLYTSANCETA